MHGFGKILTWCWSRSVLFSVLAAAASTFLVHTKALAQNNQRQTEAATRCRAPEFAQFDFWLGSWDVRNASGKLIGHNDITRVSHGCGLLENWRDASGGTGVSINHYDGGLGKWTQRWVGEGASLWLEGGLQGPSMVLSGTSPRHTPRGDVLDRITWTPLPDGRVAQVWEISTDNGKQWAKSFEGFYQRSGDSIPRLP